MASPKKTLGLPTITEAPTMEEPKTPTRKTSTRPDTPIPDEEDDYKTAPNAPRLVRTGPVTTTQATPDDNDEDALFSKERPDESPTLKHNRRQLQAAHIDPRYLDRPIARPIGPRPAPAAPQRTKRHRHSEPVGAVAGTGQEPSRAMIRERVLVGPRPLTASPSVRGRQLDDPFGTPQTSPRPTASIPTRMVIEDSSDSPTPKASRVNKRQALSRKSDDEDIYDA